MGLSKTQKGLKSRNADWPWQIRNATACEQDNGRQEKSDNNR